MERFRADRQLSGGSLEPGSAQLHEPADLEDGLLLLWFVVLAPLGFLPLSLKQGRKSVA